jgi:PAS domain-containing protein
MRNFLKEPIQRKIFLLAVVFFVTLAAIVTTEGFLRRISQNQELAINNQRSRHILGKVILRKLSSVELDFNRLESANNRRDVTILGRRISSSISDIESVLNVLQNGGNYKDIMPTNFDHVNEITEHISFSPDKDRKYVIEALELTPRILDIKQISIDFVRAVNDRLGASSNKDRIFSEKQISLLLKQTHTFLLRSREDANRISYETNLRIQHLEREQRKSVRLLASIRHSVLAALGIIGIGICILTICQIGSIIDNRNQAEEELAKHRDHLEQLVDDRTADLASAKDKLQILIDRLADMEIGINIIGADYRILFQNTALSKRFGDLTGKLCYEGYMGRDKPCDPCQMRKALASGNTEDAEVSASDGRKYEVLDAPLVNTDGTSDSVLEVMRDITERKQAEDHLKETLAEQGRMNRLMIGREGRVMELKKQVNELLEEMGREKQFQITA